jgi:alanine-synthesizing transaminase
VAVFWSKRTEWEHGEDEQVPSGIVDLTESNPTRVGFAPGAGVLTAFAKEGAATYEPVAFGLPSARTAVAAYYGRRGAIVQSERIVLTASTSEAYLLLLTLLADPGDEVLVPSPSYPLFSYIAGVAGVRLVPYPLRYDGEWHIDSSELKTSGRTRAIIVVSPNNPTGQYLSRAEMRTLSAMGLPLIVDEVFADYPLDAAAPHRHLVQDGAGLLFSLSGLSKVALLPQAKCSWCVVSGPRPLVTEALRRLEVLLDTFLSVSGPVQHALPELLAYADATQPLVRARLAENLSALRAHTKESVATVLRCEGGFSAIVRLPAICDEDAWCARLADNGVRVQPGYFFDLSGGPYVVLSLLPEPERFADGVRALIRCLP